jgi:hypothetical protein
MGVLRSNAWLTNLTFSVAVAVEIKPRQDANTPRTRNIIALGCGSNANQ